MRGFPLLLAHIEVIVACRAPPIDTGRRLAGDEAPVLPEILSLPGATATMQAVDHGGSDPARL
jgi:hypothetical protein